MHCQTGGGLLFHVRSFASEINKSTKIFLCVPQHHLTNSLNISPGQWQPQIFHKEGDSSNYPLTVLFCLKSLSWLREGKLEKPYADIVKLNLIGTVKTARVW